jgi:hypothetical protein
MPIAKVMPEKPPVPTIFEPGLGFDFFKMI